MRANIEMTRSFQKPLHSRSVCHGAGLKGLGDVPGIAGRDPIYIFRQLFDMKEGRRKGDAMALMKAAVDKLTIDDMIALSAYSASLEP